jgi:glycosyltransferase involved in cell wall biosynthesis
LVSPCIFHYYKWANAGAELHTMTTMRNKPKVSVCMPVYNGAAFMREALDSILNQTLEDFELIISDNSSTDATEKICRDYATRNPRIRYYRSAHNRGAAWNYNCCVEHARGEYFKWAAHDDICAPKFLEQCVAALDAVGSQAVLAYPRSFLIDGTGSVVGTHESGLDLRDSRPSARVRYFTRRQNKANPLFGVMRSDALRRTRGHGSFPSADIVLLFELALLGQIIEVDDRLFLRRVHAGNSCAANRSIRDLAIWFDPQNTQKWVWLPFAQVFFAALCAIRRSGLSVPEELLCYAAFTWEASKRLVTRPTNNWVVNGRTLDY